MSLYSCKTPAVVVHYPKNKIETSENSFYATYSNKLGIKLNGTEDKNLIKEVSEWIGAPYKYGGADRNGTDCSGFTMAVYKKVYHINLFRSSSEQVKNTDSINKSDLRCGDLVFFKISDNNISHVGLYIADDKFVHASTKRGVVVNDLSEDYYVRHYVSSGRVKKNTSYR